MTPGASAVTVRRAVTADVAVIHDLVQEYAGDGQRLLKKNLVTLYEDVQEFVVAETGGVVVGCGALHVLWQDLAEIRTVAVRGDAQHAGIGSAILRELISQARALGLKRLFCLTFAISFFEAHGFIEIEGTPVEPEVYQELLASYDQGVAEFLDLEYVKPNTLGNNRMLLVL